MLEPVKQGCCICYFINAISTWGHGCNSDLNTGISNDVGACNSAIGNHFNIVDNQRIEPISSGHSKYAIFRQCSWIFCGATWQLRFWERTLDTTYRWQQIHWIVRNNNIHCCGIGTAFTVCDGVFEAIATIEIFIGCVGEATVGIHTYGAIRWLRVTRYREWVVVRITVVGKNIARNRGVYLC